MGNPQNNLLQCPRHAGLTSSATLPEQNRGSLMPCRSEGAASSRQTGPGNPDQVRAAGSAGRARRA